MYVGVCRAGLQLLFSKRAMTVEKPLSDTATLRDVVRAIEATHRRIAVVVDKEGRVAGTLTDGDVRRCILAGGTLEAPAVDAMNRNPTIAETGLSDSQLVALMRRVTLPAIPIIDSAGRFVRIAHLSDLDFDDGVKSDAQHFAAGIIMAGGEGMRLRPLTSLLPKPLIDVGGMPLIERLARRLVKSGVERIFIAVNYLGHMIEEHFDGVGLGVPVHYLREHTKLGTAGALSLLPEIPNGPVVVLNGDILTTSDIANLYSFHKEHGAAITVAAVDYHIQIPYGVLHTEGVNLRKVEEKPSQRFLCNAGIYALSPDALGLIPEAFYNMTDLIGDCLESGRRVAVFPVHEFWTDVGTPDDLERARREIADQEI